VKLSRTHNLITESLNLLPHAFIVPIKRCASDPPFFKSFYSEPK
jgi:hypothetical protein